MNSFWQTIDAVIVINLDHRSDRWQDFKTRYAHQIPSDKLHRISGVWGQEIAGFGERPWFRGRNRDKVWAGKAGCTLSHQRALRFAQSSGWSNVLILEDDIAITTSFPNVVESLQQALKNHADGWDICYLGYTDPWPPFRKIDNLSANHFLGQIYGCNCGHAYLLKPKVRDWILTQMPDSKMIWSWLAQYRIQDRWYRRQLGRRFRVVAVSPCIIEQGVGVSDITGNAAAYYMNNEFVIELPDCPKYVPFFDLRLKVTAAKSMFLDGYDWIRGRVKRIRGF